MSFIIQIKHLSTGVYVNHVTFRKPLRREAGTSHVIRGGKLPAPPPPVWEEGPEGESIADS